ncbi:MAG: hypothetical protein IPM82_19015 [Saprospiraceae bacterium]|nr:hypothetical protein [Saprospiraceae bacterium]
MYFLNSHLAIQVFGLMLLLCIAAMPFGLRFTRKEVSQYCHFDVLMKVVGIMPSLMFFLLLMMPTLAFCEKAELHNSFLQQFYSNPDGIGVISSS